MLEDRPLHAFEGRHSWTERAIHGGPRPRAVALLELRRPDALCHGGQRHPAVPQRMREGDHGCQGVEHRFELVSRHHQHHCCALAMHPLRQARRHLRPGLLQLRLIEPSDRHPEMGLLLTLRHAQSAPAVAAMAPPIYRGFS